ncbi:MAG: T9SS type A sorting domain-containing protein, partial [Bacteroidales bacterium]|nr:T9SS type A sorting domain-containing protein [Bacteroidales bacterium]
WYGTTAFNVGDLAGTKTVDVYAGTYTDEVVLNSGLNPTAANPLIIQNHSGETVIVDATENSYGFNLSTVDYVQLKGFTVHSADIDNIYAQGDNVTISYNKTYGSVGGSGIKVETGTPFTITNNLAYSNFKYGIEVLSANNIIKNNTADDNGGSSNPATGVLIWSEDWESGSYTGWLAGSGWSVYIDALSHSPTHSVELLNATNTSITYSSVDVTNYDNLTVSAWARSDASNMNGQDYLYGEYSFDNSTWIQIFYIENDHTTFINYSATGITKTSNTLYIRFRGACDALEYWMVDDVLVTGDETGSPFQSGAGLYVANVSATVENNIFVAKTGSDDYYALISPGNAVVSDYNTYYTTNTNLFDYNGTVGNAGPMSVNDITADPLFVNAGTDFHIKSTSGSYNGGEWPPLTASSGTWTNDPTDDSPAIDAGNGDAFGNEPAPNGGTINQGAYGNTLQASKSAAVVVPISWNGSVSSDWQTLNNWTPNTAIPTATDNVLIPNGMPNYPVIDDGTTIALCDDIEIENSASVTIAPNGEMTVSGIITNAAGNTGLVIQSDASGTGSLIHNNTSGIDVTVQQLLAAGGRAWHMVGSPISDATVSVFPNTTYLYYYDETNDDYWTGSTYDAGSTLGWTNYNAGALTVGNGYLYNNFQTTLNFVGLLNTKTAGDNLTLSYTDQGGTAPNGSSYNNYDGWNFVSNPYTSAIDWDLVNSAGANLYDAIYVWDDIAGTYKTYVDGTNSWDGAATNGGSKYIPAMQGFFVKFNEALGTSGTLTLPSSARVHNTQSFWKGDVTDQTPDNFMRIVVANDNFHDEAVVRFLNNATERMDNRLDAYKLFSHYNYVPQLYTLGNDNTEYSINSLPELSADKTTVVPLRVYCTSQDFSIFLSEFNFAQTRVYLRDNFSDNGNVQVYELSPNSRLNFNSNPNNEVDRFELIFVPIQNSTVFDVVDIQDYNLSVYPNPSSGSFYLRVDDYKGDYEVRISTITGQSVYKNTFTGKEYQNVLVENASTGIYLLTVILDNGIVKYERIIIK